MTRREVQDAMEQLMTRLRSEVVTWKMENGGADALDRAVRPLERILESVEELIVGVE